MQASKVQNDGLMPFFCYFGGKWRSAKRYPSPQHTHIVEPFAGAAGYSLRYPKLNVTLYDVDNVISGLWDYLIKVKSNEILKLPLNVNHVSELNVSQEAKWLIGFWLNKGASRPCLSPSTWMRSGIRPNSYWGEAIRDRIANQVNKIKHWKVINKSYSGADNETATWFVDPPYEGEAGKGYKCGINDYSRLSRWCKQLKGQVIVCENAGASWLPFKSLFTIKATPGARRKGSSEEVVWINQSVNER